MATNQALAPASELAAKNGVRFPNESEEHLSAPFNAENGTASLGLGP